MAASVLVRRQSNVVHAIAVALLAGFAALLLFSMPYESPTVDEPLHYTRGAAFWWVGDTRLSFSHPPLSNALGALPNRDKPLVDFTAQEPAWSDKGVSDLSTALMNADYGAFRAQLFQARKVMIGLAVLFGVYLYAFCLRFGQRTALFALFLYAIHPTLIAHARLMTTDMPVTIASFIALGEFARYRQRRRLFPLVSMGLALGAAMSIKYSAVYLLPVIGLVGLIDAVRGRGRFAGQVAWRRLGTYAAHATAITAITVLSVNASYRFQKTDETIAEILAEPEPQNSITKPFNGKLLETVTPLGSMPPGLRVPLPYTYVFGLTTVSFFNQSGRSSYFMGFRTVGVPIYFPVLLVLKEPLILVFLLVLAARRLRRPRALSPTARLFGGAAALFLAIAVSSRLNLGVRHVLPMMPILVVLAAFEAAKLFSARSSRPRLYRAALGIGALSAAGTVFAYPHYIGYFNALTINDVIANKISIVGEDWAQDTQDAAVYVKKNHLGPIAYVGYGRASRREFHYLGVQTVEMACTTAPTKPIWVAINASIAMRTGCYKWLGIPNRAPDAKVNEHIYFYHWIPHRRAPGDPPPPPHDDGDEL